MSTPSAAQSSASDANRFSASGSLKIRVAFARMMMSKSFGATGETGACCVWRMSSPFFGHIESETADLIAPGSIRQLWLFTGRDELTLPAISYG
jgi:hypothetical protein